MLSVIYKEYFLKNSFKMIRCFKEFGESLWLLRTGRYTYRIKEEFYEKEKI